MAMAADLPEEYFRTYFASSIVGFKPTYYTEAPVTSSAQEYRSMRSLDELQFYDTELPARDPS